MQLLNSWAQYSLDSFIDLLNNSDQVSTKHQVSVQWVLKLFLQNKPATRGCVPLSRQSLPSPPLGACLYTNMWHASDKGSCMSQKHAWSWTLRVSWGYTYSTVCKGSENREIGTGNWRAKGIVLIITFFCIIHRSFWLSMLVPSFFTCSCTHVLLLSMVQQRQANPMLLLCSKFTCFKLVFVDLWLVL